MHHDHSLESHDAGPVETVRQADDHCSHSGQDLVDGESSSADGVDRCGHQHGGGEHPRCDHGDCNFISVERSNDFELTLTFSMWCQALGEAVCANAFGGLPSLHSAVETPCFPRTASGSARAMTQVWRL